MHWTGTFGADLYGTDHRSGDVTANSGEERITYYGSALRIILVDHTIYARGHGALLQFRLGLSGSQAKQYANRRIAIPNTDKLFHGEGGPTVLTLSSLVRSVIPQGKVKVSKKTVRGTRLIDIRGTMPGTHPAGRYDPYAHGLTASASGLPLPISYADGCGMMCFGSGHFSRWNEPVNVQPPASSTPIATVRRG